MSRLTDKAYILTIGVLLLLLAGVSTAFILTRPPAVPGGVSAGHERSQGIEATSDQPTADALLGLSTTTPPLLTSDRIIFSGVAKVPQVSEVHVSVASDRKGEEEPVWSIVFDTTTGRWTAELPRTGLPSGNVTFTFGAVIEGGVIVNTERTVLVPEAAVEPSGPETPVSVEWRAIPVKVSVADLWEELGSGSVRYEQLMPSGDYAEYNPEYYKVGTVKGGAYDGSDFLIVLTPCKELCFDPWLSRMIVDVKAHRLVNLTAYGAKREEMFFSFGTDGNYDTVNLHAPGGIVIDDATLRVPDLEMPARLSLRSSGYGLTKAEYEKVRILGGVEADPIGTTSDGRTLYGMAKYGCILALRKDLTFAQYDLEIPFAEKNVAITWADGTRSQDDYTHADIGGCGATNCYAVRTEAEVRSATRLVVTGTTSNSEAVYELKNPNDEEMKKIYEGYTSTWYSDDGSKPASLASMIAQHPLLYWKDPFGRWVRWTKAAYLPQVECGKPVVYLYPKQESRVRVLVGLRGTMTVSEPEHGTTGWDVTARPDGYVVNNADGKTYPNLYWEGTGVDYATPEQGFVIETARADAWLAATLAKIGFTERENAEFREFWVPRMPKTPYTFITFVPQAYFDRDAPLRITPTPDAVTRVFMEYHGLAAPMSVEPLPLPTIDRTGFHVVEWGGALKR